MTGQPAYTDADVQAASDAMRDHYNSYEPADLPDEYRGYVCAVLDAVAPAIAARALREAADALHDPACGGCSDSPHIAAATWLRARADEIEAGR